MAWKKLFTRMLGACAIAAFLPLGQAAAVDNGALLQNDFRTHKTTYGLVYRLPDDVSAQLTAKVGKQLQETLLRLGLKAEASTFNLPHVTVVHIHNANPETPRKMLDALTKSILPPVLDGVVLKKFYTTEAAKGAGRPWWLDLGIVKSGKAYEDMMAFNTRAVAALAPLRDGPLPRVTGPVYAAMGEAGKDLVQSVGVSGVNVLKGEKELRSYNPHNTLVYSMSMFTPEIQKEMGKLAEDFDKILPDGITTAFKTVSIVELAFSGNVLREFYRIDLSDGSAVDVATGLLAR